jgi:hypothetical protein
MPFVAASFDAPGGLIDLPGASGTTKKSRRPSIAELSANWVKEREDSLRRPSVSPSRRPSLGAPPTRRASLGAPTRRGSLGVVPERRASSLGREFGDTTYEEQVAL